MNARQFEAAFFDLDGTLLRAASMFDFLDFAVRRGPAKTRRHLAPFQAKLAIAALNGSVSRSALNFLYYRSFAGLSRKSLRTLSNEWFDALKMRDASIWVDGVAEALKDFNDLGVLTVLVSGSFEELLKPIAEHLGVSFVLATHLDSNRCGVLTGRLRRPQVIGLGKVAMISTFLISRGIPPSACIAYGDHISDLPMLRFTGSAVVVGGDEKMLHEAVIRGWSRLQGLHIAPRDFP